MTDKGQETKGSKGPMERLMDVTKELVFLQQATLCWDIRAAWDRDTTLENVAGRPLESLPEQRQAMPLASPVETPEDDPLPTLATLTRPQIHHLDRLHMMHRLGYLDPVAIVNLTPLSAMTLKAESGDAFYQRLVEGYEKAVAEKATAAKAVADKAVADKAAAGYAAHQADATGTP